MADVFVSYKAEDRARVAPLVRALESDGISVWWDAHIGAGDEWRETILRQLEGARAVIVVWSRRSVGAQGQFVRDEASRALKRKTYLPIRIDKVDPPLGFGETQAHDLVGWKGDAADPRYQGVTNTLREKFRIKAKRGRVQAEARTAVSRRTLMAGGATAVICVGGLGTWLWPPRASARGESIAVMPFENLSGDPSQVYFSDGIAEELRSALSSIPGLKVVARTSSEAVRNADAVTAAAKLHVSDILTGSVRRSPEMLRISAQLVDGKDGTERWSDVYDRTVGDSLEIQSEIAQKVADALRLRLGPADKDFRARGGTDNPRAQDLYLRAEATARNNDSEAGIRAALAFAEAALVEDAKYGDAMTSKAGYLGQLGSTFAANASDAQSLMLQAQHAAQQAVVLAPLSSAAHAALGAQYFWTFQFRAALQEFTNVQSLSDRNGANLSNIGWYSALLRHFDIGLQLADEAVALDPLNPSVHQSRANVLQYAGRLPEAEQAVQRAIRLNPNLWYTHLIYAIILLQAQRFAEAQREVAKVGHGSMSVIATQAIIAERLGDRNESNRLLQQMLRSDMLGAAHYQVAQVYVQLSENDEALSELDEAWAARDPGLAQIQTDFLFDSLRKDPRFQALVRKLDFPT
jgi:TolB-like protein/Tfp pilus assembly protein PilF